MEQTANLNCYKFSDQPGLKRVADFFGLIFSGNENHLILTPDQIEEVLKVYSPHKYAWLFNYGCICLVNFDLPETYRFVKYLESTCEIDYNLFSLYNESHCLYSPNNESPELIGLYAAILSKSTELKFLGNTMSQLFDQSERFINELQKGLFKSDNKSLKKMTIAIVRNQLKVINSLQSLDRPAKCRSKLEFRQLYDRVASEYELAKRFNNIQQKFIDLQKIIGPYQNLNYAKKEKRLLYLEVFLLALFSLPYLFKFIAPKILTFLYKLW